MLRKSTRYVFISFNDNSTRLRQIKESFDRVTCTKVWGKKQSSMYVMSLNWFGTSQFTDEVTFSNTFYPTIIWKCHTYTPSDSSRARPFSKAIDYITVRSVSDTLSLTNNYVRRLFVLRTPAVQRDGLTIALSVHVVVVHTCMPPLNEEATASRLLDAR